MPIPKSGFFFPNQVTRAYLLALEDVTGRNGVGATLNLAGLAGWLEQHPPEDSGRDVDFADFSSINGALEELYGPRGGRSLARRCAWDTFGRSLMRIGAMRGMGDPAFRALALPTKLRIGLAAFAHVLSEISDQNVIVEQNDQAFVFSVSPCADCWGRQSDTPACSTTLGLLEEGLRWISDGHSFRVQEALCAAMGEEVCEFRGEKAPIG